MKAVEAHEHTWRPCYCDLKHDLCTCGATQSRGNAEGVRYGSLL